ncbi:hypothetical protein FO519_005758 [Halicephalobus sp. NKZ332]|nr:hypothetical protein FO519_005758 [Halicephalobus sp. NKZ332]
MKLTVFVSLVLVTNFLLVKGSPLGLARLFDLKVYSAESSSDEEIELSNVEKATSAPSESTPYVIEISTQPIPTTSTNAPESVAVSVQENSTAVVTTAEPNVSTNETSLRRSKRSCGGYDCEGPRCGGCGGCGVPDVVPDPVAKAVEVPVVVDHPVVADLVVDAVPVAVDVLPGAVDAVVDAVAVPTFLSEVPSISISTINSTIIPVAVDLPPVAPPDVMVDIVITVDPRITNTDIFRITITAIVVDVLSKVSTDV